MISACCYKYLGIALEIFLNLEFERMQHKKVNIKNKRFSHIFLEELQIVFSYLYNQSCILPINMLEGNIASWYDPRVFLRRGQYQLCVLQYK